ncbi:protein ALP1-like [Gouania willdenowi]|uniref:protein ALP1-like n=1 Tax=Gouania willdenowi TaxID=441366 RepID=UPI00105681F4|nr:protein ALP1-like [Gouania willdenowi]
MLWPQPCDTAMENQPDTITHSLLTLLVFWVHLQNNQRSQMSRFIECARRRFAVNRAARVQRFLRRQQETRRAFEALMANYNSPPAKRTVWIQHRSSMWWEHVTTNWTDYEFQLNFRMRKTTFRQLCDILKPHLSRQLTTFRKPLPVEQRVAICIWRLATNMEYRTISHLFGIGQSTAVTITNHVASVIVDQMLPRYIKKPSEDEFKVIIQEFRDQWGFPQCGGAIDATHIGILTPPGCPSDYKNREGFYSVFLQVVVDHRLRFWDINVGSPGKIHDACVFTNSSLYKRGQSGTLFPKVTERFAGVKVPVVLLGDAAYPLLPWLMKPYHENPNMAPAQLTFNNNLGRARMMVDRAIGRLKGRWRCLLKRCDCKINNLNTVISACCVLHNFCEDNREDYDGTDVQQADVQANANICKDSTEASRAIRDAVCAYFASGSASL